MAYGNCQRQQRNWMVVVGWCCLAALTWSYATVAQAMTGFSFSMPNAPPKPGQRASGLLLKIDSHWVEGSGYRPMTLELRTALPARADRRVHITLIPRNWQGPRWAVETDLEIAQGSSSATATVLVPQRSIWQTMDVEVLEDGRKVDDVSGSLGIPRSNSDYNWSEAFPSMLFIDSDAPDPAELNTKLSQPGNLPNQHTLPNLYSLLTLLFPLDTDVQTLISNGSTATSPPSDLEVLRAAQLLSQVLLAPPHALPTDRRVYSSVDLIFISLSDFQILAQRHPDTFRAIADHVSCGGHLLVTDAGGDFSRLTAIDQVLKKKSSGNDASSAANPWRRLNVEAFGKDLNEIIQSDPNRYLVNPNFPGMAITPAMPAADSTPSEASADEKTPPAPPEAEDMFRTRDWDMGRVIAVKTPDLQQIPSPQWSWLLEDLKNDRWRWYRRMGLSWHRDNTDFWDFMIPGVGSAPVYAFLTIITGFMILIGPINYVFLSRWKRLYLLLVTVPLCAALITGTLIGYAVIRDGLGTRARLMSFSEMTNDGKVVSWSRQTYYAGVAPSEGLVYPHTASVFPVEAFPIDSNRVTGRILLEESQQRFTSGFLPSRTMVQTVIVNHEEAKPFVEIQSGADGKPEVLNRSDQTLSAVVVYDNGSPYFAESVPSASDGGGVALQPISPADLTTKLRILTESLEPRVPIGFATPRMTNQWYYYNSIDTSQPPPTMQSGLMMTSIQEILSPRIPPGRVWVALVPDAPAFVPIGVSSAKQTPGIHFIRGKW